MCVCFCIHRYVYVCCCVVCLFLLRAKCSNFRDTHQNRERKGTKADKMDLEYVNGRRTNAKNARTHTVIWKILHVCNTSHQCIRVGWCIYRMLQCGIHSSIASVSRFQANFNLIWQHPMCIHMYSYIHQHSVHTPNEHTKHFSIQMHTQTHSSSSTEIDRAYPFLHALVCCCWFFLFFFGFSSLFY